MIAFSCPHCDAELEVPDSRAGATVKCPECEERFTVPARGKRGPAPREREPERRARQAPASRGSRRPARSEREEGSKQNMGLILACVGGAAVLGVGMIIAVVMLLRAGKDEPHVEHPVVVSPPIARVNPPPQQTPPADAKPPEVKGQEPPPGSELPGNADSGQTVYKHLLKSAAWIAHRPQESPAHYQCSRGRRQQPNPGVLSYLPRRQVGGRARSVYETDSA
jgi:predicted Zn finger-like uncharacterized protein